MKRRGGRGRGPNNKGAGRYQTSLREGGGRSTYLQTPAMCMGQWWVNEGEGEGTQITEVQAGTKPVREIYRYI